MQDWRFVFAANCVYAFASFHCAFVFGDGSCGKFANYSVALCVLATASRTKFANAIASVHCEVGFGGGIRR